MSLGINTPPPSVRVAESTYDRRSFSEAKPPLQATFSATDLELMHHYSTSTAGIPDHCHRDIWQVLAPQEAFTHPFLLHAILALAALHKAYLDPSSAHQLRLLGIQHYASAVTLFRPELDDIRPDNAIAVFFLSGAIMCIAWAIPQETEDIQCHISAQDTIRHILDTMRLSRGMRDVALNCRQWAQPLEPIFNIEKNDPNVQLPSDVDAALGELVMRIRSDVDVDSLRGLLLELVLQFRLLFPIKSTASPDDSVYNWPTHLTLEFFDAAYQGSPLAIAILAFHGAMMYSLKSCWWGRAKARSLVEAAVEILPHEYQGLIRWPVGRIATYESLMT